MGKVLLHLGFVLSLMGHHFVFAAIDRSVETAQIEVYDGGLEDVSVISYEYMEELFHQLASHPRIPFKYPDDGCYARAHKMSLLLEQIGILTVKSFIIGDLQAKTPNHPKGFVNWWYHVAPALYVKDGENKTLMVFDPSIFDDPVSYIGWVEAQTQHRTGKVSESYTTLRFVYTPHKLNDSKDLTDYLMEDLVDMEMTLDLHTQIERARLEGVANEDYLF